MTTEWHERFDGVGFELEADGVTATAWEELGGTGEPIGWWSLKRGRSEMVRFHRGGLEAAKTAALEALPTFRLTHGGEA